MKLKKGLVLEGGSVRGYYTAGVLDVFMEHDIRFDGVMGVSAGAIHGCSYLSNQKGRDIRYYKKYGQNWRFMSFRSLFLTGNIVGEKFCYHEIPEKLDPYDYEECQKSETDFYVTCSNLETGKPEYFKITDLREQMDLIRASASMPYVSQIVSYQGKKLLDGGCTDSIPVKAMQDLGYRRLVVILTRQEGYTKKAENKKLLKLFYHRYPLFRLALQCRHVTYNRTLDLIHRLEQAGEIFVIRPSQALTIGRLERDVNEIQKVYDLGKADAEAILPSMLQWLTEESAD